MKNTKYLPLAFVTLAIAGANTASAELPEPYKVYSANPIVIQLTVNTQPVPTVTTLSGVDTETYKHILGSSSTRSVTNKTILNELVADGEIPSISGWTIVAVSCLDNEGNSEVEDFYITKTGEAAINISRYMRYDDDNNKRYDDEMAYETFTGTATDTGSRRTETYAHSNFATVEIGDWYDDDEDPNLYFNGNLKYNSRTVENYTEEEQDVYDFVYYGYGTPDVGYYDWFYTYPDYGYYWSHYYNEWYYGGYYEGNYYLYESVGTYTVKDLNLLTSTHSITSYSLQSGAGSDGYNGVVTGKIFGGTTTVPITIYDEP